MRNFFSLLRLLSSKARNFLAANGTKERQAVGASKFIAVSFMSNENKNLIPVRILPPHNFKLIKYLQDEGEKQEKRERREIKRHR